MASPHGHRWSWLCCLIAQAALAQAAAPPPRLTLEEGYQLASRYDPEHQLALEEVRAARIGLDERWTELGGRAAVSLNAAAQTPNPIQPGQQGRATLELAGALFRKSFWSLHEPAQLAVEAAVLLEARAREQLRFEVISAFIDVLRARQQLQVSQNAVARAAAQLKSAESAVRAGAALRTTVLLAAIERRRAEVGEVEARRELARIEAAFARRVGIPPPPSLELPPPPAGLSQEAARARAAGRLDLKALDLAARREASLAVALRDRILWPTLGARAHLDYQLPSSAGRLPLDWRVAAVVEVPLFQGGAEWQAVRRQEVAISVARLQRELLARRIEEEVVAGAARLAAARQSAAVASEQVKDAQENYTLVQGQLRLGAARPIELANAQALLTEAETLQLVAAYEEQLATYGLLFASGAPSPL